MTEQRFFHTMEEHEPRQTAQPEPWNPLDQALQQRAAVTQRSASGAGLGRLEVQGGG